MNRERGIELLASAILAVFVAVILWAAGAPTWASIGFGWVTYVLVRD